MTRRIAFLGTGIMGGTMAMNLLDAGFAVTVWNRTTAKTEPLAAAGAEVAAEPPACVEGADDILSILDNGPVVRAVFFESGAH